MPRRSYAQYCAVSRALDALGERWTLLVVRELLTGPRRYTDLHADLPGVSTDVLASRLKEMERDGIVERRRLAPPGAAYVYELTDRGREIAPALAALARWGAAALGERRPTDALRGHWFALPLMHRLEELASGASGMLEVALDEGAFRIRLGAAGDSGEGGDGGEGGGSAGGGAVTGAAALVPDDGAKPDARLLLDTASAVALATGDALPSPAAVHGEGPLADALRAAV
ncbi:winged helix-turn-helix transcriptional regulator [Streptomyces sp. HB2AG]|uniref:winged helix-turn-helix transcriptional regulator n=1 Tax=Streptomyces sp. HB2AG TaxID=2983400 RepID=UPI0022AA6A1C|nr:helix-turn-helix domain-containing protein [Streptomyces sp. HB2AG]MCZ2523793.1 helix-turn-helix domain-containing protein [Streptomyces sp. HB2AG]